MGGGRGGRGGRGSTPGDAPIAAPNNQMPPANQAPADEWDRYYALNVMDPSARPVLLTTTDGLIENQTSIAVSADGKTFYYCTNAKDIERRHIWAVPTGGGTPAQITAGEGVETYPAPLASGKYLATLSASWNIPQSLGVWKLGTEASAGPAPAQKIIFPTSRPGFPMDAHVKPETIITKAPDGLEIHNQVFLPKDLKAGERRPAIVFCARRTAAANDAGLPLHAVLPLGLRHQSVARQPGLHRDVDQLPQRHRLRSVLPHGAEYRWCRQQRVSGRGRWR